MARWMNLGQQFKMNSARFPDLVSLRNADRCYTYFETNDRVNRLASALLDLGFGKGDKIAVVMENCVEFVEIYLATAKLGLVIVPVNFRLLSDGISYIINNSGAAAVCFNYEFLDSIKEARDNIPKELRYIIVGGNARGCLNYDFLLKTSINEEPDVDVLPEDPWILIYTSGTTGMPKGVVRSHESHIAFYLINSIDFGFGQRDVCMNIMPLCHINSVFFSFVFLYIGASVYIHYAQSFDPKEVLEIVEKERITFMSLIPTHYNLILNLPDSSKKHDVSSISKLLCSSASVEGTMKLAIMDFFPGVDLYEAYGSSEAGIVTVLKPEDQMKKLGSIGYESLGTDNIKILDQEGKVLSDGTVGEIYSSGPMLFDGYYNSASTTLKAFAGHWFSAGDMGYRDSDGFYVLVDRKDNMIITGGEHVYPSEVEGVISGHSDVFEVAVIGASDYKWGEKVLAVVVPVESVDDLDGLKSEIMSWCRKRLAGFKRPKDILFIDRLDMPRTATGKILHRVLRKKFDNKV